jgi:hypothetical protein
MCLFKLAVASATGYAMYRMFQNSQKSGHGSAAFAHGEATPGFAPVRNAGPEAMRSDPAQWDRLDEEIDESFPASDPPPLGKR